MDTSLVNNLQNPDLYDHPTPHFQLIETHSSWVILTGEYTYKLKKPVDFEFLDYSTLAKRKHFCQREIELNRRLAPKIYLEVVTITGSPEQPQINGENEIIDYAIKMREFSQKNILTHLLEKDKLTESLLDKLAMNIANFHQTTEVVPLAENYGTPEQIYAPVVQNFDQIRPLLTKPTDIAELDRLEEWAAQQQQALTKIFKQRKQQGFIRACHGDLHLGNMVLIDDQPVIFDCIEFNEDFRFTDTMADLGFVVMDLQEKQRFEDANRLINIYLQQTGDYAGLQVLPYYIAYRAVVRAKVALFALHQPGLSAQQKEQITEGYRHHLIVANCYTQPTQPLLIIMHGFSASGKSTIAQQLVGPLSAMQIRSDVERKRMQGHDVAAQLHSPVNKGLYSFEMHDKTYQHLATLADNVLRSGYSVIVDATFLQQPHRRWMQHVAEQHNIPRVIIDCQAPTSVLQQWLTERQTQGEKVSEARLDILAMQQEMADPLTAEEKQHAITLDVSDKIDLTQLLVQLRNLSD